MTRDGNVPWTNPADEPPPSARSSRRFSTGALLIPQILGALLVGWFVVRVAWLGGVVADVGAFEVAYLIGFAGYLLVLGGLWLRRGSGIGGWGWWLAVCVLVRLVPLAAMPSDDLYRCLWEGRVQRAGHNPYRHAPDDEVLSSLRDEAWPKINHRDYPAIYPPIAQMEFLLVASIHPTVHAVKAIHVLWDALTVAVLGACLRRMGRPATWAIVYGLCPLVLTAGAVEGHVDSLMLLLVAMTVWATLTGRWHWAGATLGLAISAKVVAVVLLPWLLWRHWRSALVAILVLAATYLPYASAGWGLFESLLRFPQADVFFSFLPSIGLVDQPIAGSSVVAAALLGAIVVASAVMRKDFVTFAGDALMALLLLMPVVHAWYLTWVLVFVPLRMRWCWVMASGAMVAYYEAWRVQAETGVWSMPPWAAQVVWAVWLITASIELLTVCRRRGLARAESGSPW